METIDKMYTDFTSIVLPKVAEGFMITKDYFIDLFGRYVKFLIIQDAIYVGVAGLILLLGIAFLILGNVRGRQAHWNDGFWIAQCMAGTALTIGGFIGLVHCSFDLAKSLTVPEIRVYEELMIMKRDADRAAQ